MQNVVILQNISEEKRKKDEECSFFGTSLSFIIYYETFVSVTYFTPLSYSFTLDRSGPLIGCMTSLVCTHEFEFGVWTIANPVAHQLGAQSA
jgi:hypothetical protein